ncbi:MAG: hypothetical protein Q4F65_06960 [Propionibacteriaceae bacterium]|nr:hypothetical protein [Propionibacteriaceae bacterium]
MFKNPVLVKLLEERAKHVEYVGTLLTKVDEEGRDLVEAETRTLETTKQRIEQIDAQIKPLEEFEATRAAHEETVQAVTPTQRTQPAGGTRLGVKERTGYTYPTPGHFIVDKIRSQQHWDTVGNEQAPDSDAVTRLRAAVGIQTRAEGDVAPGVHQTTEDTPGLLPVTIQGQVLETLDGLRPFLQAIGIKPLAGIPGKKFHRPHITQHTKVGKQTAEKAELASRDLKIEGLEFEKDTVGGWLNISRQEIDWTSPSAWNIILQDLQAEYAEETDAIAAAAFEEGVTQSVTAIAAAEADNVDAWVGALYEAAVMAATKDGTQRARVRRLPDTIFTSVDMWGDIGAMLDIAAINKPGMSAGDADAQTFAGSILRFPRIMVPGLPAGTVVVGRKAGFEYYEERIGLLSAVVPKVFGVEIAYGGYTAAGFVDPSLFAKITVAEA